MIANHGRIEKYNHLFEGRNSRLDGLQAAILSVKLKKLPEWIQRRIELADIYRKGLEPIGQISIQHVKENCMNVYHLFIIRTELRDQLKEYLSANNIQTGIHYPISLPKLKAYKYLNQNKDDMKANYYDSQLLSLPIGEHLTNEEVNYVVEKIKFFFKV